MKTDDVVGFVAGEAPSSTLVVLLHASGRTAADMVALADLARENIPAVDTWAPRLAIESFLTRSRGVDLTAWLLTSLDGIIAARAAAADGGRYENIILLGHSYGAMLARAVWAIAQGGQPDGTVCREKARSWARRISRLVLLAAVARGWNPAAPVTTSVRIGAWFGALIELAMGPGFAILDVRRGAPFLTTVRLQTLAVLKTLKQEGEDAPITVQLLGTVDDVVAPADNVDLATGSGFYYVEVPGTDHLNVVQFEGPLGEARRELLRKALIGEPAELHDIAVSRSVLADMVNDALDDQDLDHVDDEQASSTALPAPLRVHPHVKTVVFVVHGIRDYGYWTHKLAVRIKERARQDKQICRTVTSSYGFFPMGPFLIKAERRKRVGWLMDQYVTARAAYPNADTFCFVGHSNGTYLLARALLDCPALRFNRVVFAGSVVRPNFEWQELMTSPPKKEPQVGQVLNYVATSDFVVATVPSALQVLNFSDLGGAGHCGFPKQPNLKNILWVPGGHGAALRDEHWNEIADFVLKGDNPPDNPPRLPGARALRDQPQMPLATGIGKWAWAILPVAAAVICVFLLWVLNLLLDIGPVVFAIGLLAMGWLVSRVLTRV